MTRQIKHTHRALTAEEARKVAEARRLIAGEEAEIRQKAREYKHSYLSALATLRDGVRALKSERERMGLSLAEIAQRTGIESPSLARLENEAEGTLTVATLARYANALGKRLSLVLTDASTAD